MSIYHFHMSSVKANSARVFDYVSGEGKYRVKQGELTLCVSGNMPAWADDEPRSFWSAADKHERANARLALMFDAALPVEAEPDEQIALTMSLVKSLTATKDGTLPYTAAIHCHDKNPHLHIIISERPDDGIARSREQFFSRGNKKNPEEGGALKSRAWKSKDRLLEERQNWEEILNSFLEPHGFEKVSCRSLKDQGLDRPAQIHLPRRAAGLEKRGIRTREGDHWRLFNETVKKIAAEAGRSELQTAPAKAAEPVRHREPEGRADEIFQISPSDPSAAAERIREAASRARRLKGQAFEVGEYRNTIVSLEYPEGSENGFNIRLSGPHGGAARPDKLRFTFDGGHFSLKDLMRTIDRAINSHVDGPASEPESAGKTDTPGPSPALEPSSKSSPGPNEAEEIQRKIDQAEAVYRILEEKFKSARQVFNQAQGVAGPFIREVGHTEAAAGVLFARLSEKEQKRFGPGGDLEKRQPGLFFKGGFLLSFAGHDYAKAREAEAQAKEAARPALAEEAAANRAFGQAQRELEVQRLILADLKAAKRSKEEKTRAEAPTRVQERLEPAPVPQTQAQAVGRDGGPAQEDHPSSKSKSMMR